MSEKTERLINLVIALKEVRRPVPLSWIRDHIHAYLQDDAETARRQFERDKDDLRKLGIPIETRETDALGGELGYIIDRRAYELPEVDLNAEEVAALAVALRVTGEDRARLGYAKLAARAPDPDGTPSTPAAQVRLGLSRIDDVATAMRERRPVEFGYTAASGETSQRTVDPYAVVARRGNWYVVGRDHERDATRAFRLDRVTTPLVATGSPESFTRPDGFDPQDHVAGPDGAGVDITVAIAPRVTWEAEARGAELDEPRDDGWRVARLYDVPLTRTFSWIVGLADEAELLEPAELRERAAAHLRAIAEGAA